MYTDYQYDMMERLENGLRWEWFQDPGGDEVLRFLLDQGICCAREDLAEGMLMLTQKGLVVLKEHRENNQQRAEQAAKDYAKEIQRIKERKQDRRDKWLIGVICACCGAVLTLCVEHFEKFLVFFRELFHS